MLLSDQELPTNNHTNGLNQLHGEDFNFCTVSLDGVKENDYILYVRIFLSTFRGRGQPFVIFAYKTWIILSWQDHVLKVAHVCISTDKGVQLLELAKNT